MPVSDVSPLGLFPALQGPGRHQSRTKGIIVAALVLVLAMFMAELASESVAAADPPASIAPAPMTNERAGLDNTKQAGPSRNRDLEDRKQPLAARLAEEQRLIEAAKKGAIISDFLRRM